MYVDDQDEEVEEEEEFHEVEEEKHKTSQESVGTSMGSDQVTRIPDSSSKSTNQSEQLASQTQQEHLESGTEPLPNHEDCTSEPQEKAPDDKSVASVHECDQPSENSAQQINQTETDPAQPEVSTGDASETGNEGASDPKSIEDHKQDAPPNDSAQDELVSSLREEPKQQDATDWANIMLNSKSKSAVESEGATCPQPVDTGLAIDSIIKQTQGINLNDKITENVLDQVVQNDLAKGEDSEESPEFKVDEGDPVGGVEKKSPDEEPADNETEKKKLDLDEDEENPQYIPKKGDFYEHDDRSLNVDEIGSTKKDEDGNESKDSNVNKRSSNQEKQGDNRRTSRRQRIDADRWNHDLFRDEKQKPKSTNAHGYESRQQERVVRNQGEGRAQRSANTTDRLQGSQDSRSRQGRDGRLQRQNNNSGNRSRERKPRRQNLRNNRADNSQSNSQANLRLRDANNKDTRSKPEVRDAKESDDKLSLQPQASFSAPKKDHDNKESRDSRNTRTDSRGRRRTSRDRPMDDKLPPPNTVMPSITTWSNEDMIKAEAFSKDSPSRQQPNQTNSITTAARNRPNEIWSQGQPNKNVYQDRPSRNHDENRHHNYMPRSKYPERADDMPRLNQSAARNQFTERSNHNNQDWHRGGNYSSYGKPNDYIKTQTFENSRLAQANRSNNRDLRDVLNERRMHNQQYSQAKPNQGIDLMTQPRGQMQSPQYYQYGQQHIVHQSHVMAHHQAPPHVLQQQLQHQQTASQIQPQSTSAPSSQQQLRAHQSQHSKQASIQMHQQSQSQAQSSSLPQQHHLQSQRQQGSSQSAQTRLNSGVNNATDTSDSSRLDSGSVNSNDPLISRPIIKTDAYTGTTGLTHPSSHQAGSQHMPQHSQNHRVVSGSMAQQQQQQQQGPSPSGSHMVPSHLSASNVQTQYYTPSNSTRDPATAAAMASAYHGYIPSGHTVMDSAARYHMASQQMSDHGYMTSPGQAGDVAAGPVIHQQGMYADTTAGGTVASSAYMAQAGSTLSPSTTIPVTGSGGPQPLPQVSYLQHSQYPPPPYSNPYSQHQHGQAPPPHSGQAYPPYWAYIQ